MVTKDSLDVLFGRRNVERWSDLNNDEDPVEMGTRITWAISLATNFIQAWVRASGYAWAEVSADPLIEHMIATKAGLLLYSNRAISDEEQKANPMRGHLAELKEMRKQLSANQLQLPFERTGRPFPAVVDSDGYDLSTQS